MLDKASVIVLLSRENEFYVPECLNVEDRYDQLGGTSGACPIWQVRGALNSFDSVKEVVPIG